MTTFAFCFDDDGASGLLRAEDAFAAFKVLGTDRATLYPLPENVAWPGPVQDAVWVEADCPGRAGP